MHRQDARFLRFSACATLLLAVTAASYAQQPDARIEHLLQAAVHLEQAELTEQAAEIRELLAGQDQQLKQRLRDKKLAQIEQLQAEVAQLQQALESSDDRAKVTLRLKVLELSLDKLSQVGLNLVSIRQLLESDSPTTLVDAGGDIIQFLEMLQAQGFAEMIAAPTLVTRDGRRAAVEIGSAVGDDATGQVVYADPAAARRAESGSLRFECTPTIGAMGLLELDLRFQRSSNLPPAATDGDSTSEIPPGGSAPAADGQTTGIKTRIEMLGGQTLILACRESGNETDPSTATLLMLETEVASKPQ